MNTKPSMKRILTAWVTALVLAGLTACGVTPSTPQTGTGKKYGTISDVTCPDGDDDRDGLCNSYEQNNLSLGPQCMSTDDCDGDGKPDEEETNEETGEPHKNNSLKYFLLGALTVGVLEAVYHPINNTIDWIKNKGGTDVTAPNGETATIQPNQIVSTESETKFVKKNGDPYLIYYRKVVFKEPMKIDYNGNSAELSNQGLLCIVAKMTVAQLKPSGANAHEAKIQLRVPNRDRAQMAKSYTEFKNNCLFSLVDHPGVYMSFERYPSNPSNAFVERRLGGEIGFGGVATDNEVVKTNFIHIAGLSGSPSGLKLYFVDDFDTAATVIAQPHNISESAPVDLFSGCSNNDCKMGKILQKTDGYDKSVSFIRTGIE